MDQVIQPVGHGDSVVHQFVSHLAHGFLDSGAIQIRRDRAHDKAVLAEWLDIKPNAADLLDLLAQCCILGSRNFSYNGGEQCLLLDIDLRAQAIEDHALVCRMLVNQQ